MNEDSLNSRLSRISTVWGMLRGPGGASRSTGGDERLALIQRYQGAAYRYLLGAVRDAEVADELFQEFALRVMQGAFCHADPQKGRFRDYLKTTLFHLVVDHQRRQRNRPCSLDLGVVQPAAEEEETPETDRKFRESWREEILARAWDALAEAERQGGPPHYRLLRFRAEHPEASSAEMATWINEALQPPRPFTEAGIRKALQRAREQFAVALIDDVAHSLGEPTPEQLEQELIELELLPYCRSALVRRYYPGT